MQLCSKIIFWGILFVVFSPILGQATPYWIENEFIISVPKRYSLSEAKAILREVKLRTHWMGSLDINKRSSLAKFGSIETKQKFSKISKWNNNSSDLCAGLSEYIKAKLIKCEPNYVVSASVTPNDPRFSNLWGIHQNNDIDMDLPEAWALSTGSNSVVIGIVDTGMNYNHPDLQANMWQNPGEVPNNYIDDDNNGYIDDVYGINAITNSGDPLDDNGHGTHVAGTIGGVGNNGVGVVGVNWNVKMVAAKFLDSNGSGSISNAIQSITYLTSLKRDGVNIVAMNNSWGGSGYSAALESAIQDATESGIIFVAAAGNESSDNDSDATYPANYDVNNKISVAAIDTNGNLASFSNYGENSVDIAAPGVSILSTIGDSSYEELSGTSMATPHVTGLLGLIAAYDNSLSAEELIERILESGVELDSLDGLVRTKRIINAYRALTSQTVQLPAPTPLPTPYDYQINSITYAPDTSMRNEPIVIQSDEANYTNIDLPFSFPYFGSAIDRVIVSPNGVVYTKSAPSGMDYQNASIATKNSIAALHTDLYATSNPYGVRVKISNNKVQIYWLAKHFSNRGAGDVEVWLELYQTGFIKAFYNFGDSVAATVAGNNATIGITGGATVQNEVFQYNSSKVKNKIGLVFVPEGLSERKDSYQLKITSTDGAGRKLQSKIIRGAPFNVEIDKSEDRNVSLSLSINDYYCGEIYNGDSSNIVAQMPKDRKAKIRSIRFALKEEDDPTSIVAVKRTSIRFANSQTSARSKAKLKDNRSVCKAIKNSIAVE